ncbi:MAG TPA: AbrB/MazE/SpoVT family DNA-binding domain-containing protein [Thermoanaerobaculia bacterium]|nr:AbrB/MazE/SpoVT family DNA-binding domain-containing protein [Thermoanaerobaculia bacterium]
MAAKDDTPNQLQLGPQGRLVIPAEMRRELGFQPGESLVARIEGGRLVLEKPASVLSRLKARFASLPQGVSLADELVAERREQAREEEP